MNPQTVQLLMQLITLAAQLAPEIIKQIEGIKQQSGKSADEIFSDAGITLQANDAKALAILADLMSQPPLSSP